MFKKWIIRILAFAALAVFLYSMGNVLAVKYRYWQAEKLNNDAINTYTQPAPAAETERPVQPAETESLAAPEKTETDRDDIAPIEVDFAGLQEINPDIWGWIYCEDTSINYPVAHCSDNDFYLNMGYNRKPMSGGTIFSDAGNRYGVQDSNIIIYGHHMQDKSMFHTLKYWFEQEYYDEHPVMWLLTPEQDYRIDIYSVRSTPATSDAYMIYYEPDEDFEAYILKAKNASSIYTEVEPDGQLHHVMLSTCAYSYVNERTVIHGQLVPLNSAGGVPIE